MYFELGLFIERFFFKFRSTIFFDFTFDFIIEVINQSNAPFFANQVKYLAIFQGFNTSVLPDYIKIDYLYNTKFPTAINTELHDSTLIFSK